MDEKIAQLLEGVKEGHICLTIDGERCYLPKLLSWETDLVEGVRALLARKPLFNPPPAPHGLSLEQKEAFDRLLSVPFGLLTGGPGTGKTHTAAAIAAAFLSASATEARVRLLAPSGKAVARLREALVKAGVPGQRIRSSTLHEALRLTPDSEGDPVLLFEDLILVDECSMIDLRVFARLLRSPSPRSHLLLMGDPDQLPAVEVGSVFSDLVELGKLCFLPLAHLSHCLRAEAAGIVELASSIREERAELFAHLVKQHHTSLGFDASFSESTYERLWQRVRSEFPFCESGWDGRFTFRLLSCLKVGPLGVDRLNQFLAARFFGLTPEGECCPMPILATRALRSLGIASGEEGILYRSKGGRDRACFQDREITSISPSCYEIAYALSVHKSQGSEFERVLFLMPKGSELFGKEILYTAVTRAKKSIEIDGNFELIMAALTKRMRRQSGIVQRLS